MIQVWEIDNDSFYTGKTYLVEEPNEFQIITPCNTSPDNNFYKPKWDSVLQKWVEWWTEEEIQAWKDKQIDILEIKRKKIQESKELLATWLENNPMLSEIHNPDGEYYTVTQEKQAQLTQLLMLYSISVSGGAELQLTWNSTGGVCEDWTYEELSTLSFQIAGYVLPRVKMQQEYEVQINACATVEEVEAVEIEYEIID